MVKGQHEGQSGMGTYGTPQLAEHAEPTAQMPAAAGCSNICIHVSTINQNLSDAEASNGLPLPKHRASNQAAAAAPGLYLERDCFCHFSALHCCIEAASRQLNGPHVGLQAAVGSWLASRVFDLFKQFYSSSASAKVAWTVRSKTHNDGFDGSHHA